jgi:CxxC-x17-CxxC domain-containing protein
MSKTPNFDKLLDEALAPLKPHDRTCRQCRAVFKIYAEDIDFYKKLRVPPPTLCPSCRMQRRLGFRISLLPIFHKRSCQAPGHTEKTVSLYSEQNPVRVYDNNFYATDNWDGLEFGADYDTNKNFFEQWRKFSLNVPRQALQRDLNSVNCEYTTSGFSSKNCYYVGVPCFSENVYYSSVAAYTKDSMDVDNVDYSERCYRSVYLDHCYNCSFCYESSNCADSYFLYDCKNCSNCFGCVNLRNKSYCWFNEQLTKDEYEKRLRGLDLGKRSVLRDYERKFQQILAGAFRKNLNNVKTENSFGNDLRECKNCFWAFRVIRGTEDIRYFAYGDKVKDAVDIFSSAAASLIYDSTGIISGSNIRFSGMLRNCLEAEYSNECNTCENIFACFGLKNKKFCIFNKQYSEDEYWRRVDELKTAMLQRGEYGEFFPLSMSSHPYNKTNAAIEEPLSKEEVLKNGWFWEDEKESEIDLRSVKTLSGDAIPDDIKLVSDEVLNQVIICEKTGKPFRIVKPELDFYRGRNLPLPTIHPLERMKSRLMAWRHPFRLWKTVCSKCGKEIWSGYDPVRKLKVYCEQCYQAEVV